MIGHYSKVTNVYLNVDNDKHQIDKLFTYFWMYEMNQQASITEIQPVTSSTLRQIWSVIESNHASLLLRLNDTELLQQLLRQLADKTQLNGAEICGVRAYIYSRIPLIRDEAQARLAQSKSKRS